MDPITQNLKDPSWWFTGLFFLFLGIGINYFSKSIIARVFKVLSVAIPSIVKSITRKKKLRKLRRIRYARFHPLLIIREISRADTLYVIATLTFFIAYSLYFVIPGEIHVSGDLIDIRILRAMPIIMALILQRIASEYLSFLNQLIASSRKIGTTKRLCGMPYSSAYRHPTT